MEQVQLKREALEWREVEGEVVALDLRTQMYLAVNRVGAAVWPALAAGAERSELVDIVVGKFNVTRETASEDIDAFLDDLAARDLLEPSPVRTSH